MILLGSPSRHAALYAAARHATWMHTTFLLMAQTDCTLRALIQACLMTWRPPGRGLVASGQQSSFALGRPSLKKKRGGAPMQLDPWPFPLYGRATPKSPGSDLAAASPVIDEKVVRSPGP